MIIESFSGHFYVLNDNDYSIHGKFTTGDAYFRKMPGSISRFEICIKNKSIKKELPRIYSNYLSGWPLEIGIRDLLPDEQMSLKGLILILFDEVFTPIVHSGTYFKSKTFLYHDCVFFVFDSDISRPDEYEVISNCYDYKPTYRFVLSFGRAKSVDFEFVYLNKVSLNLIAKLKTLPTKSIIPGKIAFVVFESDEEMKQISNNFCVEHNIYKNIHEVLNIEKLST